ncbi:hypothetical protein SARC_13357, partial [Sphaeroforma arctica JP610]
HACTVHNIFYLGEEANGTTNSNNWRPLCAVRNDLGALATLKPRTIRVFGKVTSGTAEDERMNFTVTRENIFEDRAMVVIIYQLGI